MYNVLSHTPAIYTVKRVVTPLSSAYGNSVQRMKAYAITMVWRWKDEQHQTNQNRLSERNQKKYSTEHLHNVAIKKNNSHRGRYEANATVSVVVFFFQMAIPDIKDTYITEPDGVEKRKKKTKSQRAMPVCGILASPEPNVASYRTQWTNTNTQKCSKKKKESERH